MNIMANWIKTTPYGNYDDPLQNHKFDGELHFKDEETMTIIVRTRRHELLHHCRTLGTHGKHVGSKPTKNLISPLRRLSETREIYKRMLAARAKRNNENEAA